MVEVRRGIFLAEHGEQNLMASMSIYSKLRVLLKIVRLRPFDTSDAAGRGRERHRRIALSGITSAAAKAFAVVTTLLTVPLTLSYLGPERYGMWMAISSLVLVVGFADFGIGNGLISAISECLGNGDQKGMTTYVGSAFALLISVAFLLSCIFALLYPHLSWDSYVGSRSPLAQNEAGPTFAVMFACFFLSIPISIVQKVQSGLQQSFAPSLWQCVGSLLGFAGVMTAVWLESSLPVLALSLLSGPLIASILNAVHFFFFQRRDLMPSLQDVSLRAMARIARTGFLFFLLQLSAAVSFATDNFVIAQTMGASAVAGYAVAEKLFGFVSLAAAIFIAPLWPAYGEATARGDISWIRTTLRRSITVSVGFVLLCCAMLTFTGISIVHFWVGDKVEISIWLLASFSIWKTVETAGMAIGAFLNGAGVLRLQVALALSMAVVAICMKFAFAIRFGVVGVPIATALVYIAIVLIPIGYFLPRIIRGLERSRI